MKQWIAIGLGGVLGLTLDGMSAASAYGLIGAALGGLVAALLSTREQLSELRREIDALRNLRVRTPPPPVQPAAAEPVAAPAEPREPIDTVPVPSVPDDLPAPSKWARPSQPATARPAAEPQPVRAPEPDVPPSPVWAFIAGFFTGGNALVRAGVIILFIGVAFLLKYVAERTTVPLEVRLYAVAAAALALLAFGWQLRKRRRGYALAIQGGALGILYLTVYASLRLFDVLPAGPAFGLLVILAALGAALALLQGSLALAMLGIGCGFLAPVLASSGQGDHVVLFGYYLVLNLGVFAIAWFRAWRVLNLMGFVATFLIGTVWGVLRYEPQHFATTEPFLIAFFLLYVGIAVLFARRQPPDLRGYVDGPLVFGLPTVVMALQWAMVHEWPYASAKSAIVLGAFYLLLVLLLRRGGAAATTLVRAFTAIGIAALSLAVPLALDDRWTAGVWALEGAGLVWAGVCQRRALPVWSGLLLQLGAGGFLTNSYETSLALPLVLGNAAFIGGALVALAAFASAMFLTRAQVIRTIDPLPIANTVFAWGLLWVVATGLQEVSRFVADALQPMATVLVLVATAIASSEAHRRWRLVIAQLPALLLLPMLVAYAAVLYAAGDPPFRNGGAFAWIAGFVAFYGLLKRHEAAWPQLRTALHAVGAVLLGTVAGWELAWQADQRLGLAGNWREVALVLPLLAMTAVLPRLLRGARWPVGLHATTYRVVVGPSLLALTLLWSVLTDLLPGEPWLAWLPLLNPLEITQALVLLVGARFVVELRRGSEAAFGRFDAPAVVALLVVVGFAALNAMLLRTLHHRAGVPWTTDALAASTLVQTALSIFWTVIALCAMVGATRRGWRRVWIVGASLLGVVVVKLLAIDLSSIGTVERIVSFVGVGLLMLVVGYFSPLPPAVSEDEQRA